MKHLERSVYCTSMGDTSTYQKAVAPGTMWRPKSAHQVKAINSGPRFGSGISRKRPLKWQSWAIFKGILSSHCYHYIIWICNFSHGSNNSGARVRDWKTKSQGSDSVALLPRYPKSATHSCTPAHEKRYFRRYLSKSTSTLVSPGTIFSAGLTKLGCRTAGSRNLPRVVFSQWARSGCPGSLRPK